MIYLVEDDGNIREFVLYALTGQGYDAQEKPSQFFAALERQLPELVLLDLMLPEEDGLTVLRRLRTNPVTRHLPVIILSAKIPNLTRSWAWTTALTTICPSPSVCWSSSPGFGRCSAGPRPPRPPGSTGWAAPGQPRQAGDPGGRRERGPDPQGI